MSHVWDSMVYLICSLATSNCTFMYRYSLHWRSIHDDITVCLQQAKDPLDDYMYLMQTDCFVFNRRRAQSSAFQILIVNVFHPHSFK